MLISAFLNGCAVGPEYKTPELPTIDRYTASPLAVEQDFAEKEDIPRQWWRLFHSKPLNNIIKKALAANPDLKAAHASLRKAQEMVYAQIGAYYPSLAAGAAFQRQKTAKGIQPFTDAGDLIYSLYSGQVSISYIPDVFGSNKKAVESLTARAEAERYELEAVYLTLTSNVVATVVQEASLRSQISATKKLIKISTELFELFKKQESLGDISHADTTAQEAVLARILQDLPPLEKKLAQTRNQLTVLMGEYPSNEIKQLFDLESLNLPNKLPISIPSKLVERRPDVKAAEENLRAANAEIGIAMANRLPNVNITANFGTNALSSNNLFNSGASVWGLAAGIAQPIFQGFSLMHKQHAAVAAFNEAGAKYRSAVINAFRNVADALQALDADTRAFKASLYAERTAKRNLEFARKQWLLGDESYLSLVNAQEDYEQALIDLILVKANRLSDAVALFQALGGGWIS
ncbi:MAG: efflux transporter outer membrane subunit [Rickettsiaceae bacterium]|nr:efflux transporter outer membrane subunit [Rickettsiaceae bacterium]